MFFPPFVLSGMRHQGAQGAGLQQWQEGLHHNWHCSAEAMAAALYILTGHYLFFVPSRKAVN